MTDPSVSRSSLIWKFAIMGAMLMMVAPLIIFILDADVVETAAGFAGCSLRHETPVQAVMPASSKLKSSK